MYKEFRDRVAEELANKFKDKVSVFEDNTENSILVAPDAILKVCTELKDNPEYCMDYLSDLSSVDYPENFTVVYHLSSVKKNPRRLTLKVQLPKDKPKVASVSSVWNAANVQEREVYDLMGITFDKHPNLKRILLPDDFVGHPLRKDFKNEA